MAKQQKNATCFVVGPIGEAGTATRRHADWLLKAIIIPVFNEFFPDFAVVRSDTITAPGMIDAQMIGHLLDAELVIADMTERNPNAFYEMGIRHMAAKPIVHMFDKSTIIPFDVAPHRAIPFAIEHVEDIEKAKVDLKAAVSEAIDPDFVVDNPVTRARGRQNIAKSATPEMQFVMDEVDALKSQVNALFQSDLRVINSKRAKAIPDDDDDDGDPVIVTGVFPTTISRADQKNLLRIASTCRCTEVAFDDNKAVGYFGDAPMSAISKFARHMEALGASVQLGG
jgi:hypothetical protein